MFIRYLEQKIRTRENSGKAIIIFGARQVGKTTLLKSLLQDKEVLFLDGDDPAIRVLLTEPNTQELRSIIGTYKYVFLDEAQRIQNIGLTLKIIVDQFKDVRLYVSGSSSFYLGNSINEPLTGRKWEYTLYPISWEEFEAKIGYLNAQLQLENRLIFGFYPEVLNNPGQEREILHELVNSYLYRDILALAGIRKPEILEKLVRALAFQAGSEVNYNELSQIVGISKTTVQSYIDVLEKSYIIYRLGSFSRNLRNEITQGKKVYFWDNGIRNAVISNFSPLELRTDKGSLWENFLITERLKQNNYKDRFAGVYFWRTKQQQEIDLVEEVEGKITGYEFKWSTDKARVHPNFLKSYSAGSAVINKDNFRDFVCIVPNM